MRTPEEQARIMLKNIKQKGYDVQYKLYGKPGKAVVSVYNPNASDSENVATMTAEIYAQGPRRVSKHCMDAADYAKLNVIDISRTRIKNYNKFIAELSERYPDIYILDEPKNGCIHIEISQP